MSDMTERIVTEVCAALLPPEKWGTVEDENPGWTGSGLEGDAHAAAAATLRCFALHMPRELREQIQLVAAELVLAGPAVEHQPDTEIARADAWARECEDQDAAAAEAAETAAVEGGEPEPSAYDMDPDIDESDEDVDK